MAVYEKLLLSSGGGVISEKQQADQVKNSATLLIGLGGTGVDCLRTIKTQVYSRLKPDEPKAIVPRYEHIRFLGVDTDESSGGFKKEDNSLTNNDTLPLDSSEFFSIANKNLAQDLSNPLSLAQRKEVGWLTRKTPNEFSDAGAGGIRQIGRYMMMSKSDAFMQKVEQELDKAKTDLHGANVYVHIFSGLSGGTGSGTFLDVCYMVRSIVDKIGGGTVFGYFFLPDVNLDKVSDPKTREYIPMNGYAAMQELDYCMRLQPNGGNGGAFTQLYAGNKEIEWNQPPVDMCHLVSAYKLNGDKISDAYKYAMNVVAEYVMEFLTATKTESFGLKSYHSNFVTKLENGDAVKHNGYNLAYCTIGAACAQIPLREINTYLASELFDKFSVIGDKTPSENEVKEIFSRVMGPKSKSSCYDGLLIDIKNNMSDDFDACQYDFKDVLDMGDHKFVDYYVSQMGEKKNAVESNFKGLLDAKNKDSLMGRLNSVLRECIVDVKRGPIYANKVMEAAESHNFWNFLDGLVAENNTHLNQLYFEYNGKSNRDNYYSRYEKARDDFFDKKGFGAKKRFEEYENRVQIMEKTALKIYECEKIAELLESFKKLFLESEAKRYKVLARIMGRLMETFRENKATLASEKIMTGKSVFVDSMMSIGELKDSLDAEVAKNDIPNKMKTFMEMFLADDSPWISEDEKQISRLVTNFFMDIAFNGFAEKTITSFLSDKYHTQDNEQLAKEVYKDWIKPLTDKAAPMFYLDTSIWSPQQLSDLRFISVPSLSEPVKVAAERMKSEESKWDVNESALTDRIYVMSTACVFPICACKSCSEYERSYFSAGDIVGRHYYENVGLDIDFNDWRKLPSITPQSLILLEKSPAPLAENVREGQRLYERAKENNVFDENNEILCLNDSFKAEIEKTTEEAIKLASEASNPEQLGGLEKMLQKLESFRSLSLEKSGVKLENGGYRKDSEVIARVQKDYFVSSPAYWKRVDNIVSEIEEAKKKLDSAVETINSKIDTLKAGSASMEAFFDALFTGVFEIKGKIISYKDKEEFDKETILSQIGDEFPYGKIPVYQAFKSYEKMDSSAKESVKVTVETLLNEDISCVAQLREVLSSDKMKAWNDTATALFFENSGEIKRFLLALKDKCRREGIQIL